MNHGQVPCWVLYIIISCHLHSSVRGRVQGYSTTQMDCWLFWPLTKQPVRASLVAQWLRIHLPMQGTRVWALVREDPTCRGATKPVSHNYWACASGAHALQQEKPLQWETHALQQIKINKFKKKTNKNSLCSPIQERCRKPMVPKLTIS